MDRRNFKILILGCLCLVLPGVEELRAQEPGVHVQGPVMVGVRAQEPVAAAPGDAKPAAAEAAGDVSLEGVASGDKEAFRRLEQLPPEERETFKRNLAVWRNLTPDERTALRNMARVRTHAEVEKAVQDLGLHLNQDEREMFALRYSQERRKLERDLQHKAAMERARRMPEILAKLKSEFSAGPTSPGPSPAAAEVKPEQPGGTPMPGFMR